MKRPDPLFKLRLPEELRAPLEYAASISNRSLTAEILSRLTSSLTTPNSSGRDDEAGHLRQRISELLDIIDLFKKMDAASEDQIRIGNQKLELISVFVRGIVHSLKRHSTSLPDEILSNVDQWEMFGKLISPETKIKSEGREFFEGLQAKRPSDSGELRAGPELESEVNDQPSSPNPTTSPGGADPHARARRGTRPPKPLRGAVDKEALKESLADAGASSSAENGQEGGSPPADDEFAHVRRRIRPNPQASEPLKPAEPKPGLRILPKPKR